MKSCFKIKLKTRLSFYRLISMQICLIKRKNRLMENQN